MSGYQARNRRSGGQRYSRSFLVSSENLEKIIVNGDPALIVSQADRLGRELAQGKDKLSTSQIRAIFGEVRQIQGQVQIPEYSGDIDTVRKVKEKAFKRLYLLKPKMRYRVAKENNKRGIKNLVAVLDPALDLVFAADTDEQKQQRFAHFVDFFEAILAYHRAYGGK